MFKQLSPHGDDARLHMRAACNADGAAVIGHNATMPDDGAIMLRRIPLPRAPDLDTNIWSQAITTNRPLLASRNQSKPNDDPRQIAMGRFNVIPTTGNKDGYGSDPDGQRPGSISKHVVTHIDRQNSADSRSSGSVDTRKVVYSVVGAPARKSPILESMSEG